MCDRMSNELRHLLNPTLTTAFDCACSDCELSAEKALQTVEIAQPVSSEELTVSELQQQMEEIQCEMEKRNERAAKYKRLYYEEKKKCEEVTAQLQMLLQVL